MTSLEPFTTSNDYGLLGEEELKPCPFCGGRVQFSPRPFHSKGGINIQCVNSECEVNPQAYDFVSEAAAVSAWNKRVMR